MNQDKINLLKDEKDELIKQVNILGKELNTPKKIIDQSIAHIMSKFQQMMKVIIKEQEKHKK